MLFYAYGLLGALAVCAHAESTEPQVDAPIAEPIDFNITQALLDLEVPVEELPVADLVSRSSNAACAVAVRPTFPICFNTDGISVHHWTFYMART